MSENISLAVAVVFIPTACVAFLSIGIFLLYQVWEAITENIQKQTEYPAYQIAIVGLMGVFFAELGLYGGIWLLAKNLIK